VRATRLGNVQAGRGSPEVQFLGDGDEMAQQPHVEVDSHLVETNNRGESIMPEQVLDLGGSARG
jgi:hypothetical protein